MRTPRWQLVTYATILLLGIVTALPNLFSQPTLAQFPGWFPKQQVTLGLDLRGGSHLVLEVDRRALIRERVQSLVGDARRALREGGIATSSVQRRNDTIIAVLKDGTQQADAVRTLQRLATPVRAKGFGAASSDLAISTVSPEEIRLSLSEQGVRDRIDAAVEQSLEIIRQRIDQVGVAEPTIQRAGAERILVQLPGVQDPARIRQVLGSIAKLTFHMYGRRRVASSHSVAPTRDITSLRSDRSPRLIPISSAYSPSSLGSPSSGG
jgi:SecD/SecF fusion protein